jgi:rod shape-determining protein MreC
MALPDTRHRARYLFIAVVVGHILLISAQVGSRSGPPLLQAALVTALTSVQRASWAVVAGVRGVWDGYVWLRGVRGDNERLTRENTDLRVQLQQERSNARGAGDMRALLDLRSRTPWKTTAAEVVAGSASPSYKSIVLDKGRQDGVQRDMAVINAAGIVGRVVVVAGGTSVVQLAIDRNAAAACVIERTGAQGIVLGNGDGSLRMEYLSATAEMDRGDRVVTSGTDRVYPKGLLLGVVEHFDRSGPTFRSVIVRPVVDFSQLASVLVLLAPAPSPAPAADDAQVTK